MERYRRAFLTENQLWLQSAFSELQDERLLVAHRESLLRSLASITGELGPDKYAPSEDLALSGLQFGAGPVPQLALAASLVQQADYRENEEGVSPIVQILIRMWRDRAKFLMRLESISNQVRLDPAEHRPHNHCEMGDACLSDPPATAGLVVVPIYTLMHLASTYRTQRDMSPLWNIPLWKHFYKTFTPTCSICERCRDYYYMRNQNIPVDEKRFQALREAKKSTYTRAMESEMQLMPVPEDSV